jgi:hypothetical protein
VRIRAGVQQVVLLDHDAGEVVPDAMSGLRHMMG